MGSSGLRVGLVMPLLEEEEVDIVLALFHLVVAEVGGRDSVVKVGWMNGWTRWWCCYRKVPLWERRRMDCRAEAARKSGI